MLAKKNRQTQSCLVKELMVVVMRCQENDSDTAAQKVVVPTIEGGHSSDSGTRTCRDHDNSSGTGGRCDNKSV